MDAQPDPRGFQSCLDMRASQNAIPQSRIHDVIRTVRLSRYNLKQLLISACRFCQDLKNGFPNNVSLQKVLGVGAQFTVAPPQHFLYFFPEPHGHGSLRPTLGALRRGSLVRALALTYRCDRK